MSITEIPPIALLTLDSDGYPAEPDDTPVAYIVSGNAIVTVVPAGTGRYFLLVDVTDEVGPQVIQVKAEWSINSVRATEPFTVSVLDDVGLTETALDDVSEAAGLGTGATARRIVVTVEDDNEDAIAGARVHVLTEAGNATNQAPTTSIEGTVELVLNDGDYLLRVVAPNGYGSVDDVELAVTSSQTPVTVTIEATTITPTPAAGLCTVYTTVLDASGEFIEGATMRARLVDPNSGPNGAVMLNESIEAETDEEGYVSLDLVRADQFADGTGEYQITVSYAGEILRNVTAAIPNQDSVNLEDIAIS